MNGRETEVKFHVNNLRKIEMRLLELKAHLIQSRAHEINLRFDTSDSDLRKNKRVLRLRQDDKARLTFKCPSVEMEDGVASRTEIEFAVEDFESAKQFLEALGFHAVVFYEKFRATYELNDTHIMLDELPYGTFVEIEGEDIAELHNIANQLGLNWGAMIKAGYHALYSRVSEKFGLDNSRLSFEELKNAKISAADLEIIAAD
ncbi:MAG: class IV adenylate cyclase [Anaerolineales bacterium]|nr:class IV adenylate cyclase [Anaerolineales bacterium]